MLGLIDAAGRHCGGPLTCSMCGALTPSWGSLWRCWRLRTDSGRLAVAGALRRFWLTASQSRISALPSCCLVGSLAEIHNNLSDHNLLRNQTSQIGLYFVYHAKGVGISHNINFEAMST